MITKPKEYIDILLKDMVKTVEMAVRNHMHETYRGMCSPVDSSERLRKSLERVDEVKREIFYVLKIAARDTFEDE